MVFLKKPGKCANCGMPMAAGDPAKWKKSTFYHRNSVGLRTRQSVSWLPAHLELAHCAAARATGKPAIVEAVESQMYDAASDLAKLEAQLSNSKANPIPGMEDLIALAQHQVDEQKAKVEEIKSTANGLKAVVSNHAPTQ